MSYGNPNNPYGAPQQPQPGYGYPQAPPVQQPYGAPVPQSPQGTVAAARVLLWVIVGLQVLGVALFAFSAVVVDRAKEDAAFEQLADYPTGALWGFAVFALLWGVFAAVLAAKFGSGGNGLRVAALVFGILTAVFAVYPFTIAGVVHLVLGILIAVFVGNTKGKEWFNRPRH
ncbi:membrane protein [Streptomyces sp. F-3]|jgi:hypothetical protein|uniref:Integral membrane protein n=1 Tax=Streptomyces thermogriseus TaxID=75292 RepID=A0ABN1T1D6_9ACTN|nr:MULTISPECIES: hypothetical protein [Streptomyces]MDN5381684.1 hypothetical protein [Streptomyces sp. LB8]GAT82046.1 membrane protein [Streptomyces sp. F-3]